MTIIRILRGLALTACVACVMTPVAWAGPQDDKSAEYVIPSSLSQYDFATRNDLLLSYHLRPLVSGTLAEGWPILEDIEDQLGEWVTQFISAQNIANTITQAMPTTGQPPLRQIDLIVEECCKILHVEKPEVYVRNHPFPQAYVALVGKRHFLVLTSGLVQLYEGSPAELRFVVGHELGHLKCQHLRTKCAAYGLLTAVQSIDLAIVPDKCQAVIPTLGLGRLFSWSRESEISADRAGLLCCQNPQVAYNALSRLLTGIGAKSSWIAPDSPDFDANAVIQQYREWEKEPFVEFVMVLKKQSVQSPFIPERLAALKLWAESDSYRAILGRTSTELGGEDQIVVIKSITAYEMANMDESIDPYIIAYDGEQRLFHTNTASGKRSARWKDINQSHRCRDGQPVFFEIWDSNWAADSLIGGFVIYPVKPKGASEKRTATCRATLVWDWKQRSSETRNGMAEVEVEFRKRAK